MAKCLRPIVVNVATFQRDHPERLRPFMDISHRYKELRPYLSQELYAPCGKCVNCLKNKQACSAIRCQEEMNKRGRPTFCTLTYDDDHLPLAQSLWRTHIATGVSERITLPEIIYSCRSIDHSDISSQVRDLLPETPATSVPRYFDFPCSSSFNAQDPGYEYFVRVTPSTSREDCRLWIKSSRMAFFREYGRELSPFSYCVVSEYGSRSCRPHYHILFFGLPENEVVFLLARWRYGFTQYKVIPRFNADGSDAYARSSKYVSKYLNKGSFECDSVKCGCAERPRVCQSKGLGKDLVNKLTAYVCGFDLYGKYDLDTLRLASGQPLSDAQIDSIVSEIPKRLTYSPNGKDFYPLPRYVREKIFQRAFVVPKKDAANNTASVVVHFRPAKIWSLVQARLLGIAADLRHREFAEFCAREPSRSLSEDCAQFKVYSESVTQVAERAAERSLLAFYQNSKF